MLQRTNSREIRTWLYDDILYKTWHNISSSITGPYMCQLNTDPMKSRMGILQVILHNVSNVLCRGCDFFLLSFSKGHDDLFTHIFRS